MESLPSEPKTYRSTTIITTTNTITHQPTNPSPSPRDVVIHELEQYLTSIRSQVDEGGDPSVIFPQNYDDVVSCMGRGDITPHDGNDDDDNNDGAKKPWTHYLLEEGIAMSDQGAFAGYQENDRDVTVEEKVLRGLAKIKYVAFLSGIVYPTLCLLTTSVLLFGCDDRQLDRELAQRTREAKENEQKLQSEQERLRQSLDAVVQSLPWDSIPRKAFFLEHKAPVTATSTSGPSSPLPTDRSNFSDIIHGRRTFLTSLPAPSSPSASSLSTNSKYMGSTSTTSSSKDGPDWVSFNIKKSGAGTKAMALHLTDEDEKRYQELVLSARSEPQENEEEAQDVVVVVGALPPPVVKEAWVPFGEDDGSGLAYGLTEEEKARIDQIDAQLGAKAISTEDQKVRPSMEQQQRQRDYLDVAREERMTFQRLSSIDAALRVYQQVAPHPDLDDEASLLSTRTPGSSRLSTPRDTSSAPSSSAHSMGSLMSVAYRPISRADIADALQQAKQQLAQDPLAQRSEIEGLLEKMWRQGLSSLPPTPIRAAPTEDEEDHTLTTIEGYDRCEVEGPCLSSAPTPMTVDTGVGPDDRSEGMMAPCEEADDLVVAL